MVQLERKSAIVGMASITRKVETILQVSDSKDALEKLSNLVEEIFLSPTEPALCAFVDRILSEEVSKQVSKTAMTDFITALQVLQNGELLEIVCNHTITAMKRSFCSFYDLDHQLRERLFKYQLGTQQYSEAARTLSGVTLDNSSYVVSDKDKADLYVRCAETFLLDDEAIDAETFVNKASGLINSVGDKVILLRYRVLYARVLDANRKFLDAAVRYYELSISSENVVKEDLLVLYSKAMICAILGKASQQRKRLLSLLYRDERRCDVETLSAEGPIVVLVLTKMLKEQIITSTEMTTFAADLLPHQKALTSENLTIPEKSAIEHNICAVGKVYENIELNQLAEILNLDEHKTEKFAATMIKEGRLKASIDQADGLLFYDKVESIDIASSVFEKVVKLVASVEERFPSIVAATAK